MRVEIFQGENLITDNGVVIEKKIKEDKKSEN